jgi:hypothetical protein
MSERRLRIVEAADLENAKSIIEDAIADIACEDRHHPARSDLLLAIACISRAVAALDGGAA